MLPYGQGCWSEKRSDSSFFFKFFINLFIYLFIFGCVWVFVVVRGLLTALASLVAEHGL